MICRHTRLLLGIFLLLALAPAFAAPRDAAAVLNRCGKPLKGDETILESTAAGGRRILMYERGNLNFEKVANDGWTFKFGTHRKSGPLEAAAMETFMPCLRDALADSASPEPLVTFTPVQRAEVSVKRSLKEVILFAVGSLVILGLIFYLFSKRQHDGMTEEAG